MERKFRSLYIGVLAVISVGLLGTGSALKAYPDTWNQRATVTLSKPVAGVPKIVRAWLHSAPQPLAGDPTTPAAKRLSDSTRSNALTWLLGLGFLSLSGVIPFLPRGARKQVRSGT